MTKIGILNGPNLNRLGKREPDVYGHQTLADLIAALETEATRIGCTIESFQSNHEGALIDQIERWTDAGFNGVIFNPAAFTHTSVALRDAISASALPFVEVHISNVHQREAFRQQSYTAGVSRGVISGLGFYGYTAALRYLSEQA